VDFSILNVATSGVVAQQTRVDAVGHNLANMQTPGFRAIRPELVTTPADPDVYGVPATATLTSAATDQGVAVSAISRPDVGGATVSTQAPLDVALPQGVYLAVQYPGGQVVYTRDGHLSVGADGSVSVGMFRLAGNLQVPVGKGPIHVDSVGHLTVDGPGGPTTVGTLPLVVIPHPEALNALGQGAFGLSPDSGAPRAARPADLQGLTVGAIEGSNVQVDAQLTDLIRAQRAYGANLQVVHTWNQLSADSVQELGRP
jgi:flagellar basal-body rod protein FlgG